MHMNTLGDRLRKIRIDLGFSQEGLANLAGIKQQSLQKIESGATKNPKRSNIEKLANALNISPEYLLFGKEEHVSHSLNIPLIDWSEAVKVREFDDINKISQLKKFILPDNYFALIVKDDDDSMISEGGSISFPPGTTVIVKPTNDIKINQFAVIKYENQKILLRKLVDGGKNLKFSPLNAGADSFLFNEIEIIGVVVASMNLDL